MTSKEAIEIAKKAVIVAKQQRQNEADDEENEWFDSNIEGLEQAEKDLEILEILKKHLTTIQITGFGTEKYKDIVVIPYEDEEDAERVRKWLEKKD